MVGRRGGQNGEEKLLTDLKIRDVLASLNQAGCSVGWEIKEEDVGFLLVHNNSFVRNQLS
jgi:hypothetical protein